MIDMLTTVLQLVKNFFQFDKAIAMTPAIVCLGVSDFGAI